MASRPSVYVSRIADAYGGEHPNRVRPCVTTDLRVFYPPNREGILTALTELDGAYHEAREQLAGLIERNT
ncbi:hypothetical protein FGG51_gp052 [Mycobacterium phage Astro]|uniref:Uncharacterized protein n=1 Tax=Mycobacterium phage Astro TaxID=2902840 RepID=I6RA60_9CAUD|nr:hypothetical protein FGG51_gp052 [Mycobacterium phage Astro]AFM54994.1 hypothetical protein ASTRO_54 [Mycobacterium phage Astro]